MTTGHEIRTTAAGLADLIRRSVSGFSPVVDGGNTLVTTGVLRDRVPVYV